MAEAVWSVVDVVSAVREPFDDKKLEDPTEISRGKSRALTKLLKYLPETEIKEYREMFLGGGSVPWR